MTAHGGFVKLAAAMNEAIDTSKKDALGALPPSLARFQAFHDAYLGRILADTAHFDRRLLEVVRHFLKVFADAGKLCIRVRERDVSAILDDDRVKEMVELGHGTTNGGPAVRKDVVAAAFDADVANLAPDQFPKYGYLGPESAMMDMVQCSDLGFHYGNVRFVLRRETMAARTTLCMGNGVNFGCFYFKVPTWLDHPEPTCFLSLPHHVDLMKGGVPMGKGPAHPEQAMTMFAVACLKGMLTKENFHTIGDVFEGAHGFEFFELHYHGHLVVSRDVERVDICRWTDETPEIFKAVKPRFDRLGIPCNLV